MVGEASSPRLRPGSLMVSMMLFMDLTFTRSPGCRLRHSVGVDFLFPFANVPRTLRRVFQNSQIPNCTAISRAVQLPARISPKHCVMRCHPDETSVAFNNWLAWQK